MRAWSSVDSWVGLGLETDFLCLLSVLWQWKWGQDLPLDLDISIMLCPSKCLSSLVGVLFSFLVTPKVRQHFFFFPPSPCCPSCFRFAMHMLLMYCEVNRLVECWKHWLYRSVGDFYPEDVFWHVLWHLVPWAECQVWSCPSAAMQSALSWTVKSWGL